MERLNPKHMMSSWGEGDALPTGGLAPQFRGELPLWLQPCSVEQWPGLLSGTGLTWKASFAWEQLAGVLEIHLPWSYRERCV